jgi:hypothetical protein
MRNNVCSLALKANLTPVIDFPCKTFCKPVEKEKYNYGTEEKQNVIMEQEKKKI